MITREKQNDGINLKLWLAERSLSLREFAKMTNLTAMTISNAVNDVPISKETRDAIIKVMEEVDLC